MCNESEIVSWKFTTTAKEKPQIIGDMTIEEWLRRKYENGTSFGLNYLMNNGTYRHLGWEFDFRPYLTSYVYLANYGWVSAYAPNKTYLRKAVYGRILEIYERK